MLVHFRHDEPYQRAPTHVLRAKLMPTISKQTKKWAVCPVGKGVKDDEADL